MDKRLVVVIDSWPADSTHPMGHYVRTLGTIGDKDTETVSKGRRGTAYCETIHGEAEVHLRASACVVHGKGGRGSVCAAMNLWSGSCKYWLGRTTRCECATCPTC